MNETKNKQRGEKTGVKEAKKLDESSELDKPNESNDELDKPNESNGLDHLFVPTVY